MAGKKQKASAGAKLVTGVVGAVAAFAAKKLLIFAWKQVTGKEPPDHPEDPQVALREALIWGILVGAGVHTAKMLATRATSRHPKPDEAEIQQPQQEQ
jgi:Protein of unknown function (DUF4235)